MYIKLTTIQSVGWCIFKAVRVWAHIFKAILALRYRKYVLNDDVTMNLRQIYDTIALKYLRTSVHGRLYSTMGPRARQYLTVLNITKLNGLVCSGIVSRYRLQPRAGF